MDGIALIVISAKTDHELKESAARLLSLLSQGACADSDLPGLAYTLQLAREAEHRLALCARSVGELSNALRSFVEDDRCVDPVYRGTCGTSDSAITILNHDEDAKRLIDAWISNEKKYPTLLRLWTRGLVIDWNRLYGSRRPIPVALPAFFTGPERDLAFDDEVTPAENDASSPFSSVAGTVSFLRHTVARVRQCHVDNVDTVTRLFDMGLSSYQFIAVTSEIQEVLREPVSPAILFEHATIAELAGYLQQRFGAGADSRQVVTHVKKHPETKAADRHSDATEPDVFRRFRMGQVGMQEMLAVIKQQVHGGHS